jgi:calcium-dependent protein kinase
MCGAPAYVAPEVLERSKSEGGSGEGYDHCCDFWSLGVILFYLLCGERPFFDQDTFVMFDLIREGKYDFEHPNWMQVSEEAKDFISKLLITDPT